VKETVYTLVEISGDGGRNWQVIRSSPSRDSLFTWNTTDVPDGTLYRMRIQVYGDTTYGFIQAPNEFTIDNPGNGTPDVTLLSPDRNIIVSGTRQITWNAADAEGSPVTLSLYASSDNGTSWNTIASGLGNTGSYDWNTVQYANSKAFMIRIVCSDGTNLRTVFSPRFEVSNIRPTIKSLRQTGGTGNGIISVNVCAPEQLTGNSYVINFLQAVPFGKIYTILNTTTNAVVLSNVLFARDGTEGPLFDGLRITVTDYDVPTHNADSTKWLKGSSTLFTKVLLPVLILPEGTVTAVPEAADYEIRISATVIDTSKEYFGALPTPMFFTVYNTSLNRKTPIVLSEISPDGKLSFGDDLYLFKKDSTGKDLLTWEIFMDGESGSILPLPGDVYRIATHKPITGQDTFEFIAVMSKVNDGQLLPKKFSLSQNFPNPFNPTTSVLASIPYPGTVAIDVFDLLGRKVSTLIDAAVTAGEHRFEWNASALASGVYFYRMTAKTMDGSRQWNSPVYKMVLVK
jgi:hypothetical protein